MTPPSSTIRRSFTGALEVADETVPATVVFGDRSVSLSVAGDTVGEWPTGEVEVVPLGNVFAIHAEGDTVRFMPDEGAEFGTFVAPPEPDGSGVAAPSPEPQPEPEAPVAVTVPSLFDEPAGELPELRVGLADETEEDDEPEESALAFDDSADEFFAAGLNGPPSESGGPPAFRPVVFDPPEPPAPSVDDSLPTDPPSIDEELNGWPQPDVEEVSLADSDPTEEEIIPMVVAQPEAPVDDAPGSSRLARLIKRARESRDDEAPTAPEEPLEEDDTPEPITDSENLRQWGLVVAGGLVLLAIVGVVAWGLISLMGGDEPSTDTVAIPSTTVAAVAPTVQQTTPTTAAASTTVAPENRAAAATFVADWNGLAADYAYHMTISGDSVPISTAPTGTVHLTYTEDGVLELNMVPDGTSGDRDILVAMGMAVAWADPGLSPEGRKQLLGALGVDVDNPQLDSLGGELNRNGVVYEVSVVDGIINFVVTPAS